MKEIEFKKNCINTLRFIAAFQVMFVHGVAHLNVDVPNLFLYILNFFMGVPSFFFISGFLIWKSVERSSSFLHYVKKRIFRIYPELWISVAINILVLLLLFEDSRKPEIAVFATTQSTIFQFWTPGFLRGYGCGVPNGSLWTIGILIQFYFVGWLIYKFLHKKSIKIWSIVAILCVVFKFLSIPMGKFLPEILVKLYGQTVLPFLWLFLLGGYIAEHSDKIIPFLRDKWYIFLIIALIPYIFSKFITVSFFPESAYPISLYIPLSLSIIGLVYRFAKFNIRTDISYGIYLYHMIVINVFINFGLTENIIYFILAIVVSCILAYASTVISKKIFSKNKPTFKLGETA